MELWKIIRLTIISFLAFRSKNHTTCVITQKKEDKLVTDCAYALAKVIHFKTSSALSPVSSLISSSTPAGSPFLPRYL